MFAKCWPRFPKKLLTFHKIWLKLTCFLSIVPYVLTYSIMILIWFDLWDSLLTKLYLVQMVLQYLRLLDSKLRFFVRDRRAGNYIFHPRPRLIFHLLPPRWKQVFRRDPFLQARWIGSRGALGAPGAPRHGGGRRADSELRGGAPPRRDARQRGPTALYPRISPMF